MTVAVLTASGAVTVPATVAAAAGSEAPGAPGAMSHFDLARKDCLGTARNTTSKVWYTVADGVLSDVYYPTVDNTNVETLQFVVTDGSTFTDLQTRDMTYTVEPLDPTGMSCRVVSTAKSGRYTITTDYITDPGRDSVVMRTRLRPAHGGDRLQMYVRYDGTLNGNGGGGDPATANAGADTGVIDTSTGGPVPVTYDTQTATIAANRDYAVPVFGALRANRPFLAASSGFVGTSSDGLTQLDATRGLSTTYATATQGNVVQTAQLDVRGQSPVTLALGFGTTQGAAVATAGASAGSDFGDLAETYRSGWEQYDASLNPPGREKGRGHGATRQAELTYYLSANVLKASEDKTFPGAIVASLASPWGQAVAAGDPTLTYFGSYREVFARDLYETFTGLMAAGDRATARATVDFLFQRQQQPDGSMPRNSLVNGKPAPDTFGTQLDEVAYPILMARTLGMTDATLYQQHIKRAADFLVAHGPSFGSERWEEQSGYSPSTIAAEIAGLLSAAAIADANGDAANARIYRAVADHYQRNVKGWTVTTNGQLSTSPYFIRLSKTGDPNAAITYNLGNGGPDADQRTVIDQGFLELVRLGILPADDAAVVNTLPLVDQVIRVPTNSGDGIYRYGVPTPGTEDGYGDCNVGDPTDCTIQGKPWAGVCRTQAQNKGSGHVWPALAAERGEYALATAGRSSATWALSSMANMASGYGLIPEQAWEDADVAPDPWGSQPPECASIGFTNGKPAGSASPLTWSAASFVRLTQDVRAGKVLDQPTDTVDRYLTHTQLGSTVTLTAPADETVVTTPTTTVTGTTTPNAKVDIDAVNIDQGAGAGDGLVTSTTAAADGTFSVSAPIPPGTAVLTVTSTAPDGATGFAQVTVVRDVAPGPLIYETSDPTGDDNGPGNYAYPTASDFKAGAYDLEKFQVFDTGTTVTFRVQTRNLDPTFGSPLGAQLVDVYARDPAATAADTSTAASFPQRNYTIAASSAWSRLIEVQGFGQRFVDAHGTTLGQVSISANRVTRYITFSVPKAALGTPGPGWTFTVVLTGQDGFSSDQARGFQPTPQPYQFGVCATASSDPHCTFPAGSVPKAVDVLTPAGVTQSDELDYTLHDPVVLQGVTIP